jgi:hypothetical protein
MLTLTLLMLALPTPALEKTGADPVSPDPFATLAPMDQNSLRRASGRGAVYGVDLSAYNLVELDNFQNNDADIDGLIENTIVTDTTTGDLTDNMVTNNSGITTVFINSGNNVILQSNVQINVYTPTSQ